MTYAEKCKDPRWQRRRLQIMQRDDWQCRWCKSRKRTLHVHHKAYVRNCDPWEYPDWMLVTLCDRCHELEGKAQDHRISRRIGLRLSQCLLMPQQLILADIITGLLVSGVDPEAIFKAMDGALWELHDKEIGLRSDNPGWLAHIDRTEKFLDSLNIDELYERGSCAYPYQQAACPECDSFDLEVPDETFTRDTVIHCNACRASFPHYDVTYHERIGAD